MSGLLTAAAVTSAASAAEEDQNVITHGPVLGRLSAQGVGVWARTAKSGAFVVKYGPAPGALDQVSKPASTQLAHDNTGWVHITGLKADTKYFYELALPDSDFHVGKGGSYRTLPHSPELDDAD
jgi:phosphodiesterase/alkaline phosphatase D-like protein